MIISLSGDNESKLLLLSFLDFSVRLLNRPSRMSKTWPPKGNVHFFCVQDGSHLSTRLGKAKEFL